MALYLTQNKGQLVVRGTLALNTLAQQLAVVWFDLSNVTGGVGVAQNVKNAANVPFQVNVEGSWTGQVVNVYHSLSDQASPPTVAGQCPLVKSFTVPDYVYLPVLTRWVGFAVPVALTGGTASIFITGLLGPA
jgi:hypothetical protein